MPRLERTRSAPPLQSKPVATGVNRIEPGMLGAGGYLRPAIALEMVETLTTEIRRCRHRHGLHARPAPRRRGP